MRDCFAAPLAALGDQLAMTCGGAGSDDPGYRGETGYKNETGYRGQTERDKLSSLSHRGLRIGTSAGRPAV